MIKHICRVSIFSQILNFIILIKSENKDRNLINSKNSRGTSNLTGQLKNVSRKIKDDEEENKNNKYNMIKKTAKQLITLL